MQPEKPSCRRKYSICGGRNGVSSPHFPPLFLFVCILVFCLPVPDNMSRIRSVAKAVSYTHLDVYKRQKSAYRQKHESDFIIADAAARYFRENGISKLPSYKSLQAEIETLSLIHI